MSTPKRFDNNILAALLLICFVCVVFLAASVQVNRMTTESCFSTLDDATSQAADMICASTEADREQLNVIADLLAQHNMDEIEIIKTHLGAFHQHGTLSGIGLLLPDNRLILGPDSEYSLESVLDYSNELAKVPYVSSVVDAPDSSGDAYIYQAVPMEKDGKTVGILYGYINLEDLRRSITVTAFDGNAYIYVADGNTGAFLVDTMHNELGNVFDEGIMNRKVKSGFDFQEMKADFLAGRSGHIAFWSNTVGEYLYSCYMRVGFDNWMIQLAVPESVVFAKAIQIRKILFLVAAAEIASLALYFFWVLSSVRRDMAAKNQRLEQVVFMYDIQQTLFDAHKDPTLFTTALQKVSEMLTAETSLFLALDNGSIREIFFSAPSMGTRSSFAVRNDLSASFPTTFHRLASGQSLILYPEDIRATIDARDQAELTKFHIRNLMIVPVLNSGGELIGILGSLNMKRRWTDSAMLECVCRSFLMALSSMVFYRQIEQLSIVDAMTGLRNRNCYERSLDSYAQKPTQSLGCLYLDANGLHELNNSQGHAAGDALLICIGDTLRSLFPPQDCYRIGGDEFAVFCTDCTKEELRQRREQMNARLNASGYQVSVGEAWLSESENVRAMVAAAEKRMYEAKRLYYQRSGIATMVRSSY